MDWRISIEVGQTTDSPDGMQGVGEESSLGAWEE